jgi:hypothetical protein
MPVNRVVYRDCSYYSNSYYPLNAFACGDYADRSPVREFVIDGFKSYLDHDYNSASDEVQYALLLEYLDSMVTIKNAHCFFAGADAGAGHLANVGCCFNLTGDSSVDIDGLSYESTRTNSAAVKDEVIQWGRTAGSTILGATVRGLRFVGADASDTAPIINYVLDPTGAHDFVIVGEILFSDCDVSALSTHASGTRAYCGTAAQLLKLRWSGSKLKETDAAVAISAATITQPTYTYQNTSGRGESVSVTGGTVTQIDIIRGGTTVATGQTAGVFRLEHGDSLLVTNSADPTMIRIPVLT